MSHNILHYKLIFGGKQTTIQGIYFELIFVKGQTFAIENSHRCIGRLVDR